MDTYPEVRWPWLRPLLLQSSLVHLRTSRRSGPCFGSPSERYASTLQLENRLNSGNGYRHESNSRRMNLSLRTPRNAQILRSDEAPDYWTLTLTERRRRTSSVKELLIASSANLKLSLHSQSNHLSTYEHIQKEYSLSIPRQTYILA